MLELPASRLPPPPFIGAGIYALYYLGDFSLYEAMAKQNQNGRFQCPVYVGKAVPPGARKGGFGLDEDPGTALYNRLNEHYDSIDAASNLNAEDFYCRFLVVEDIWIPLAESLLIEKFSPLWNKALDGFGNHNPGKGRYNQRRAPWDVIHPGRAWAEKLRENDLSTEELTRKIRAFLQEKAK